MTEIAISDNGIRNDTSLEQLAKLKPVFDRRYGSITAGNSSPLTDGASAVLLMAEEKANALGLPPLAYVRSYAVAAVDPGWQLLMGPAYAVPTALDRAGITLERPGPGGDPRGVCRPGASNAQAWASKAWAANWAARPRSARSIGNAPMSWADPSRSATRSAPPAAGSSTTLANEMVRRGVQFGLVSICAQGGMGFAMVLERE